MLMEGRDLPVWGFPWTSNPWCRVTLGTQAERSRRDDATSHAGQHRAPVWRQEFHFLVRPVICATALLFATFIRSTCATLC